MVEVTTWIGLDMVLLGMLLVFLEIMNPGFFIAVVGSVLIVLGILVIFMGSAVFAPWGAGLTVAVAILASWGTLAAYRRWAEPDDKPITVSKDSLPGMEGRIEEAITAGGTGEVRVAGQKWHATASIDIAAGTKVRVDEVDGLTLVVSPL